MKVLAIGWLLALLWVVPCQADPVLNGDFETGAFDNWSGTALGDPNNTVDSFASNPFNPLSTVGADLGNTLPDLTLTQDIVTTPGSKYDVSFWLSNDVGFPASGSNHFAASFAGVSWPGSLVNSGVFAFTQFTFQVAAPAALTPLSFDFHNTSGYWLLDDVTVTEAGSTPAGAPELDMGSAAAPIVLCAFGLLAPSRRRKRVPVWSQNGPVPA